MEGGWCHALTVLLMQLLLVVLVHVWARLQIKHAS